MDILGLLEQSIDISLLNQTPNSKQKEQVKNL